MQKRCRWSRSREPENVRLYLRRGAACRGLSIPGLLRGKRLHQKFDVAYEYFSLAFGFRCCRVVGLGITPRPIALAIGLGASL